MLEGYPCQCQTVYTPCKCTDESNCKFKIGDNVTDGDFTGIVFQQFPNAESCPTPDHAGVINYYEAMKLAAPNDIWYMIEERKDHYEYCAESELTLTEDAIKNFEQAIESGDIVPIYKVMALKTGDEPNKL